MVMVGSKGLVLQEDVCQQPASGAEVVWVIVEDATVVVSYVVDDDVLVLIEMEVVVGFVVL
jgi:hypothetical protein